MAVSDWTNFKNSLLRGGRVLPIVEQVLIKENAEGQSKRDTDWLHPSEICKLNWCHRSSYYKFLDDDQTVEPGKFELLNIFAEGNTIHDKWQRWLADAGVLTGSWSCNVCGWSTTGHRPEVCGNCDACHRGWVRYREVPIFSEEYGVIGHSDGCIEDIKGKALIEIKSIGVGTLRFEVPHLATALSKGEKTLEQTWSSIKYPFPSHILQGQLYMFFTGIHTIVFIYECKWNQQVKEFTIHFDKSKIAAILSKCKEVAQARIDRRPPLRPLWVVDSDDAVCKKCAYKSVCWKETNEGGSELPGDPAVEVQEELPRGGEASGGIAEHSEPSRRLVRRRTDGVVR